MALITPDQFDGRAVKLFILPNGPQAQAVPVGALEMARWSYTDPTKIVVDTDGTKRYQNTETDSVEWSCSQFTIYKQTFFNLTGLTSQRGVNYGNPNWKRFVFDLAENLMRLDDQGNIVQAGGWVIVSAKLTRYEVVFNSPFEIIMTNVSGEAFGAVHQPWS